MALLRKSISACLVMTLLVCARSALSEAADVERALARQSHTYPFFTGTVVTDAVWLDANTLLFESRSRSEESEKWVFSIQSNDVTTAETIAWPITTPQWPDYFDVGGPFGAAGSPSPDGRYRIERRGPNLAAIDMSSGGSKMLTSSGTADYAYADGMRFAWSGQLGVQREHLDIPASVLWAPDSTKLLTFVADARGVRRKTYIAPGRNAGGKPEFEVYDVTHAMAGDEHLITAAFRILDVATGREIAIDLPIAFQKAFDPLRAGVARWSDDGRHVYFAYGDLAELQYSVFRVDAKTGDVEDMYTESGFFRGHWREIPPHLLDNETLLIASDRDGYRHFYKLKTKKNNKLQRVTTGPLYVRELVHVSNNWIYFVGARIGTDEDPYLYDFMRVRSDGSNQQVLTGQGGHVHSVLVSPDAAHFLVILQHLDRPNSTIVIDQAGQILKTLSSAALKPGEPTVERVSADVRDGRFRVWGSLHKPTDFDPRKSYPVIQVVHGTAGYFWGSVGMDRRSQRRQALADLGFIVLSVDGAGGVGRTRDFLYAAQEVGHPCGGVPDALELMEIIAKDRPYMDLSRVGMRGHSQGGKCAARAILEFPERVHVAVSGAGNHDSRYMHPDEIYAYAGGYEADQPERFQTQNNGVLASRLKGKLLLIHGGLDDDVPILATYDLIEALIEHDKRFDLLAMPTAGHDALASPYYIKSMWSYFAKHLSGRDLGLFGN